MTQAAAHNQPGTVRLIAADIKLAHSVFAMPFALLGTFMAGRSQGGAAWASGSPRRFTEAVILIVVCMVLARTVAMLANRLLDRDIDRLNPRTAGRAIPSGRLPVRRALAVLLLCAAAFVATCALFGVMHGNWWPTILGVPVLLWISAYPLLKRFTWLCHLYLGSSLAMTPLAAAIAVHPDAVLAQPALWLLSGAVLLWVAGFDIIYALQDIEVDRAHGLHSLPAWLGAAGSLWMCRVLHLGTLALLNSCLVVDDRLDVIFALGVGLTTILLAAEHMVIAVRGIAAVNIAFFTLNGIVSGVLGLFGIVDVLTN